MEEAWRAAGKLRKAAQEIYKAEHDAFEACLDQIADKTSFLSFSSRVLTHALTECLSDLLPNFAFRSDGGLFQRPLPTTFTQPPERDAPPRAAGAHLAYGTRMLNAEYAMSVARLAGFFGAAHAEALVAVLGDAGMQTLLATLNEHMEELLVYAVHGYVTEVQRALPESCKLPSYQYGAQVHTPHRTPKLLGPWRPRRHTLRHTH